MKFALFSACVFALSALGTGALRRYALRRRILDVPNQRSSHTAPTPRGGGVAIVLALVVGIALTATGGQTDHRLVIALLGGGLIVAAVGFVDDIRSLRPGWRLLTHFAAATWSVAWMGGIPSGASFGVSRLIASTLAVVATVWLLNLYNFMDGIDGIASVEAIMITAGISFLYLLSGAAPEAAVVPLLLATAVFGFLVWNFPHAKIFMGDVGSGFIGITIAVLALRGATIAPRYLWCWIILLGAFVVDATVTLLVRFFRRERVTEAHRTHAYQHAAARIGRHAPVTMALALVNVAWLFPLAWLTATQRLQPVVAVTIAYLPLVALVVWLGAGNEVPA
jgi:Fuc2NAc and GlcNAc transferase